VFPNASHKFYLDADLEERSRRRINELQEKGNMVDAQKLKAELQARDTKDLTRSVGPLKKADDAVFIDSTHLSIDQVVNEMIKHIKAHG
jgi:cytidylate kinase